jgi:hypothetical protein
MAISTFVVAIRVCLLPLQPTFVFPPGQPPPMPFPSNGIAFAYTIPAPVPSLIGFNLFERLPNMAYQFADGFDNYGNNYVLLSGYPWSYVNTNSGAAVVSTADYRFAPPGSLPGGCVTLTYTGGGVAAMHQNLSSNQETIILGFGIKVPSLPSSGGWDICSLLDSGTVQCSLVLNSGGGLQLYRGTSSGTALGTASANGTMTANAWYGLAMQIVVASGTAGSVQVYVNGNSTPVINSSGLNTSNDGNNYCNQIGLGSTVNASPAIKYDDFYCFDNTGAFLNGLLGGDARILTKMPASAGNYTNWTPNGLSSNFQNAAVQPPSTSDYNSNNTATTKDSYTMQSASLGVAPYFVMARASMARDDAATHTPSLFVRSGTTDSSGVVTPALTSSYVFYDAVFQNDPATSTAWTATGADNAQAGVIEG